MLLFESPSNSKPCPCGRDSVFSGCCGVHLQGQRPAPTAEALMRSRYTAYALGNVDYLLKTEHPSRRRPGDRQRLLAATRHTIWRGLTILATEAGQADDETGMVEFVAVYQEGGSVAQLHERSRFCREQGRWLYREGEILPPLQPKKNEPCWCGSGKKFKQCHGKKR